MMEHKQKMDDITYVSNKLVYFSGPCLDLTTGSTSASGMTILSSTLLGSSPLAAAAAAAAARDIAEALLLVSYLALSCTTAAARAEELARLAAKRCTSETEDEDPDPER